MYQTLAARRLITASDVIEYPSITLDNEGFITNIEFGLHCRSGKVLLGYPPAAPKMRYLQILAGACNIPVFHDLSDLLRAAVARVDDVRRTDLQERLP